MPYLRRTRSRFSLPIAVLLLTPAILASLIAVLPTSAFAQCIVNGNPVSTAADDSGGAYICWADTRAGNSDIYAQRMNASGAVWTANGVATFAIKSSNPSRLPSGLYFLRARAGEEAVATKIVLMR